MDLDGRAFLHEYDSAADPDVSWDGKKILFASNKHACDTRRFELYMMNLDGSGLVRLVRELLAPCLR